MTAPDDATPPAAAPEVHPEVAPLAWLLGTWTGVGVGGYPSVPEFRFAHEVTVTSAGTPVLAWQTRAWILDDDGAVVRPAAAESGFWRLKTGDDGPVAELLLAHGTGHVEVWYGRLTGTRVELATDLVAGTSSARSVTAGTRLYGVVDDELLWAYDMAAEGHPLQPHLSARLRRVGTTPAGGAAQGADVPSRP